MNKIQYNIRKIKTYLKTVKIGKICKTTPIIFLFFGFSSKGIVVIIIDFGRGGRGWPTGGTRTPTPWRWGSLWWGRPLWTGSGTLWGQSRCRTVRIWSWCNWRRLFILLKYSTSFESSISENLDILRNSDNYPDKFSV